MRAPLSWIREYAAIPASVTPQEIAKALVGFGFEVEEVEIHGADIKAPLVVGAVKAFEEITEFKKLIRWVELDCGEKKSRFVVCGAANFAQGDLVVVALPGAMLPGGFAISQRETYGKVSDGMICSSKELGLGQDHDGILVLPQGCATPGDDAIALLEMAEVIFDIAINPDRGYALSLRGIAREVAAALGCEFKDPALAVDCAPYLMGSKGVSVSIDDSQSASVIYIRTLENFNPLAQSPLWMQRRIAKCGMRSISLAVDVTNYVMLELGQPLHAFDRAVIAGGIHIRKAQKSKSITTLDGQKRTLDPDDLLVTDDKTVLALAGTMGGENSEVTLKTTSLAIEAARFNPISIAKNARRHKLSSEASRRFERGVDPSLAKIASARAAQLLIEYGGAVHLSSSCAGEAIYSPVVEMNPHFVATLTGADISLATVRQKLQLIGCDIKEVSDICWKIDPPSWRSDLQAPVDFVEEVARMIGYDTIPSVVPPRPISPGLTYSQQRRRLIASLLADCGLVEIQTYPFVSDATMKTMGYTGDRAKTFRLVNPISEDAPYLRTHLIPGLLDAATRNTSRGVRDFALFEMGSIFRNNTQLAPVSNPPTDSRPNQKSIDALYASVPPQPIHVGAVLIGQAEVQGWQGKGRAYNWSDAVGLAQQILTSCNLTWSIKRSDFAPWHPGRCAAMLVDGVVVAHAGELHPRVLRAYGLPERSCAFVVNLSALPDREIVRTSTLDVMPVALQDIAVVVSQDVLAADVMHALREGAGELLESITLFDRYDKIGGGQISLAFTLVFRAPDRTLTTAEVSAMREAALARATALTGAVLRTA